MKKRILSMLLVLVMLIGMLPVNAFATEASDTTEPTVEVTEPATEESTGSTEETTEPTEETEAPVMLADVEPVTVTVSFTAQAGGAFMAPPQLEMAVSSDTAENYGYTDMTNKETQVSTLDVLVAAHVVKYGDAFTTDTSRNYLVADNNFITKMFGSDNGGNVCLLVNGEQPGSNGVAQAVVSTGDLVEFFVYQDTTSWSDQYVWLALADGTKVNRQTVYAGSTVNVAVKGYSVFSSWNGYTESNIAGATIYLVNVSTGTLTSMGVTTGEDGTATITVPEAYAGQTLYLTAKGDNMAMTLSKVTVEAAPVSEDCKLTALEIAVGSKTEYTTHALNPDFSSNVTAYSTATLDYIGSTSKNYVWIKAEAPEGATITAENGKSGVTTITSGEWTYLEYVYSTFFGGTSYYGTLSDGTYNKVTITVTTEDGSTKDYIVTIPVEVDLTKSKLEWATDLASSVYFTKDDTSPNPLSVEAKYTNRPLTDTNEITYQWYSNTTASTEGGTAIEGATAATYTPSVTDLGKSYYYVVATCGEKTLTSTVTEVTVTEQAAPTSITITCDWPYTVADTWTKALGGVDYVVKAGDVLNLKAVDENGNETPVTWVSSGCYGGTLDTVTGQYTVSGTSYSYVQAVSLFDSNVKTEEQVIVAKFYTISDSSVTLATDGQSFNTVSAYNSLGGYNVWTYQLSEENTAELKSDLTTKPSNIQFSAMRPGTIEVSVNLDMDGDGVGDGNQTATATLTINGIAVEDTSSNLTKTYLEISSTNPNPTMQLTALSSVADDTITWSSADETIATVDENGVVTAQSVGSVIITAQGTSYKGGIKVVVTHGEIPYFEVLDFNTAWSGAVSTSSWKTANFKPTTLVYTGLKMASASSSTMTLKNTTTYNTDKYTAVATYTDENGEAQSVEINSSASTALAGIPFGTSTVTITLTDKTDATVQTVYTFEVTRPRDTVKNIANRGIVFVPDGRDVWKDQYDSKTEGVMYVANSDGSFAQYSGVSAARYYYRTYAMNALEAFTLTLKGSSAYTHIRYSTDDGEAWTYLGQTGSTGVVTGKITFPEAETDANPVAKVMIQILDDSTYATNVAAGNDGFADATPNTYTVWVEQIPVISAECDIATAETDHGDWYPTFASDRTSYRIMVAPEAEAPVLTFSVSEGANVTIGDEVQTPNENGEYTFTLTETFQSILVAASDGMTNKTYSFGYSERASIYYPDKVVDYLSVNSQYINGGGGAYGTNPQQTLTDSGLLSLGNFGGYVTFYLANGLTDNPGNTYGVDFYVNGNAFKDTSTGTGLGSMEPGQVWVSEDGSTWYALAGSEHYEASTIWNYSVTYTKTETGGTDWSDNYGNTMSSTHGRAFAWPSAEVYTMNDYATRDSFTLTGILIPCVDGTLTGTDSFSSYSKGGKFGYVDMLPNGTSNPYLENSGYTNASSGFDLAWAVDGAGNPVDVSGMTFHYVKVVTASNLMAGFANEKSTEVANLTVAASTGSAVGVTTAPTGVTFTSGETTYTVDFEEGKQIYEVSVPSGMSTATILVNGTAEDDNIYINNQWVASNTASREYSFGTDSLKLIRIIVQNGEKEPVIYLLKVTESDPKTLAALKFTSGSRATAAEYTLTPAFDAATGEYTLIVPDNTTSLYAWATLSDGISGDIQISYTDTANAAQNVTITSGQTKGTQLKKAVASGSLEGNVLTVTIDGETAYTVPILRQATLSKLTVTSGEDTVKLTPSFNASKYEYTADVAHDAVLTITSTVKCDGATVTVNGSTELTVTPVWTDRSSDLVITVSGGEGVVDGVYTIHLAQLATAIEILTPPTKTEYAAGETFDPTGMTLKATYSDGYSEIIDSSAYTYSPTDALSPSVTEIEVSFDGLTVKQPITIPAEFAGSGTQEDPYLIKTTEDLVRLSNLVAGGLSFTGEYFKMVNDITLPDAEGEDAWVPLGVDKNTPFSGNFDGGNKLLTVPEGGLPLIGFPAGASLSNLNIYGSKIAGFGVVNNYAVGATITIDNVTLKSGTQTMYSGFVGGYASGTNAITITNSTVEKGVTIGYDKQQKWIGSFGGEFNGTIENCVSYADVYGTDFVGGIVADKGQSMSTFIVKNCEFHGTVTGTGNYVGGIVGHGYGGTNWGISSAPNAVCVTIQDCVCTGSITGGNYVGGILGAESGVAQCWENGAGYIQNNSFTGTVKATDGTYVGGIIGYIRSLNKYNVISGNYYSMNCGAAKGIGGVEYVDTNCTTHETQSGATYINTQTSTSECPKVTGCAWKKAHNRTDDPLGADKAKLCYTDTDIDPIAVKLEVSGTYKTEYVLGDTLDLAGIVLTVHYNWGDPKTVPLADATVSGYDADEVGEQELTISYSGLTATIKIKVVNPVSEIKVTVSVLGDSVHDSDSDGKVHTLAGGNLTTWVSAKTYTVDANSTVWDVLQTVFAANGITCNYKNSLGTVYITSLTRNGVTLGEFTNGINSGWQYTLNGTHPLNGVAQQYLKDGDVIVFHYTDDYTKEQGSSGNEDDETTDEAVEKVETLIDAIGTVTLNSGDKITAARNAYDALTYAQKQEVSNYAKLTAAEAAYAKLKADADEAAAKKVEDMIDKLDSNSTTFEEDVKAAKKAYDALNADQKKLVDNYDKLVAALKELADEEDMEAAEEVEKLIDAIGSVTLDSEKTIAAARDAYDKLTDDQKALVENLAVLEAAEAKLAELKALAGVEDIYKTTGDYLENLGTPTTGSVGGEWMLIGLIRSGRKIPGVEDYYDSVVQYVQENIDKNERLHSAKSTDNSRLILSLTAIGKDVTNVDGHNLLNGLNEMAFIQKQGLNGPIWALIAFDSGNYPIPEGDVSREALIQAILDAQLDDGGWALSGSTSDADMTGMALQALAPYYNTNAAVKTAVDKALDTLSMMQNADGSFGSIDGSSSESCAQVIAALSAVGIDARTDKRFIKNGVSAVDALCAFYVQGGGFRHLMDGALDGMATEQGYYALVAYFRMRSGETALYNMTDIIDMGGDPVEEPVEETTEVTEPVTEPMEVEEKGGSFPWWIIVVILVAGAVVVVVVNRKKIFTNVK